MPMASTARSASAPVAAEGSKTRPAHGALAPGERLASRVAEEEVSAQEHVRRVRLALEGAGLGPYDPKVYAHRDDAQGRWYRYRWPDGTLTGWAGPFPVIGGPQ